MLLICSSISLLAQKKSAVKSDTVQIPLKEFYKLKLQTVTNQIDSVRREFEKQIAPFQARYAEQIEFIIATKNLSKSEIDSLAFTSQYIVVRKKKK